MAGRIRPGRQIIVPRIILIKNLYSILLNQYVAISGSTLVFCAVLKLFLRPVEFDRVGKSL